MSGKKDFGHGHNSDRFSSQRKTNKRCKDWNGSDLVLDVDFVQDFVTESYHGKVQCKTLNLETGEVTEKTVTDSYHKDDPHKRFH